MFPFGIFPFNITPQFGPWWPLQAHQLEENTPPMLKAYMDAYATWMMLMSKGNPWLEAYSKMLENGPLFPPPSDK